MNRIYNVIWSKTKKCYVVVSEIVKSSGGKVKSLHTGKTYTHMSTVMAVAALLAGVNITSVNAAAIMIDGVNAGYATAKNGGNQWSYLYNYNNPGNMSALDGTATTGYYSGSALMVFPLVTIRRFKRLVILRIILVWLLAIMHKLQVVYLFPLVIMHSPQNHLLWLLARLPYLVALTL